MRQEGLTSPSLFNIYVNTLIEELSSTHVGCHVYGICVDNLSYAGYMVLLSASVCDLNSLFAYGIDMAVTTASSTIQRKRRAWCLELEANVH